MTVRARQPLGLTLVEIIVVLAIMAGMMSVALFAVGSITNSRLDGEALRISGALRLVYGRAAINGIRYQVVFDIDSNSYRVECTDGDVPVAEDPDETEQTSRRDDRDDEADPFGLGRTAPSFDDCSEDLLRQREVRSGVKIARVLTSHNDEPVESGEVTIGFFPNGFVERSIIWLSNESGTAFMTLFVEPMSGRVRIFAGDHEVPDDFFSVEED